MTSRGTHASATAAPRLDVDGLLADRGTRIIVCCGSGGVGKTTTAAALALRAAEQGRRVCVLTIDPARRLAQSMGLEHLDNVPRVVPDVDLAAGGLLEAMMLDMKRTFDETVATHAAPDQARAIFANPFYQSMSTSFTGTQEYMAMEKLGQLRAQADEDGRWDLIVVDTPPSRSALDFLDAPQRLGSFLDGRTIKLFLAPARLGGRTYLTVFNAGVWAMSGVMNRVFGAQILTNVQSLIAALDTIFGGFRERAELTYAQLQAPGTSFLVVATPEPDALREAAYFTQRLEQDQMALAGLVLNRIHSTDAPTLTLERSRLGAQDLADLPEHGLTERILRVHAERMARISRETHLIGHFSAGFPHVPVARATAQATDVHDLDGLRALGASLAEG
ncbi:MAG: ArsA-related P-loop ATPase [Candidatus Nanopelagicales bacterium]